MRERERQRSRAQYAADPESAREYYRAYRESNLEKVREQARAWNAANPGNLAANSSKRRARKLNAIVPLTPEEKAREAVIFAEAQRNGWHVDHIKALAKGGLHHPDNLVAIPPVMNMSKGTAYWPDLHALQ